MRRYPRRIENGAGERVTFIGVCADERGEYVMATNSVTPGSGPPMHVHHLQEETLTVQHGTMGWQRLGEEPHVARAGQTVTFAPGEVHRFWNAGQDELVCDGQIRPPHNIEYFLEEVFASVRAAGNGRPRQFDAAYLLRRYRTEFAITEIPAPVQRFVFPVVLAVGRLLGRHRRFAGAPEPVPST